MQYQRPRRGPTTIIIVFLLLWVFWCAIFSYTNYVIPAWQEDQAQQIEVALDEDCSILLDVRPGSVRPSQRPEWHATYPGTGYPLECTYDLRKNDWRCDRCGDKP